MRRLSGFGLLETVLGLALLALVIVSAMTLLAPTLRESGKVQHPSQSLALGESVLQRMLSSPFDHQSARLGFDRCDQQWGESVPCAQTLGAEKGEAFAFNDVDDFLGCWGADKNRCSGELPFFPIEKLLPSITADFDDYRLEIAVFHDSDLDGRPDAARSSAPKKHKRIELTVFSEHVEPISWVAYRSNY